MKYDVTVSINIMPHLDKDGWSPASAMLNFTRKFVLSGDRFADIAPKVDAVQDAIELVADKEVPLR